MAGVALRESVLVERAIAWLAAVPALVGEVNPEAEHRHREAVKTALLGVPEKADPHVVPSEEKFGFHFFSPFARPTGAR